MHFWSSLVVGSQKHHQIPREDPQKKKRMNFAAVEEKKSEILGGPGKGERSGLGKGGRGERVLGRKGRAVLGRKGRAVLG